MELLPRRRGAGLSRRQRTPVTRKRSSTSLLPWTRRPPEMEAGRRKLDHRPPRPHDHRRSRASGHGSGIRTGMRQTQQGSHAPPVQQLLQEDRRQTTRRQSSTKVELFFDSWEAQNQNWTPAFREEFKKRRGYDPLPWLLVATKRIVGSEELSRRFDYDWKTTIEELINDNHFAELVRLSHESGCEQLRAQPYNGPVNFMTAGALFDIPEAEFWLNKREYGWWSLRMIASVAHINGKKIAAAESLTAMPANHHMDADPFSTKAQTDLAFTMGINSMAIHAAGHNPWPELKPGMTSGFFPPLVGGWQTWNDLAGSWIDLPGPLLLPAATRLPHRRCGQTVPPQRKGLRHHPGHASDLCNEELIVSSMTCDGEALCLPGGMRYRILELPDTTKVVNAQFSPSGIEKQTGRKPMPQNISLPAPAQGARTGARRCHGARPAPGNQRRLPAIRNPTRKSNPSPRSYGDRPEAPRSTARSAKAAFCRASPSPRRSPASTCSRISKPSKTSLPGRAVDPPQGRARMIGISFPTSAINRSRSPLRSASAGKSRNLARRHGHIRARPRLDIARTDGPKWNWISPRAVRCSCASARANRRAAGETRGARRPWRPPLCRRMEGPLLAGHGCAGRSGFPETHLLDRPPGKGDPLLLGHRGLSEEVTDPRRARDRIILDLGEVKNLARVTVNGTVFPNCGSHPSPATSRPQSNPA